MGNWRLVDVHITTPEFGDVTTRLAVTETDAEENTSYMLELQIN